MDISALSLGPGVPAEPTSQVTGEVGFEVLLDQIEVGAFIPPGAPPGPEPPPDILSAGEGVEGIEPNAQPQQLDFHPLPQIELDIDLPQPFWENPVLAETTTESGAPRPVNEAMEWLASQMLGGFFAAPVSMIPVAVPPETKIASSPETGLTPVGAITVDSSEVAVVLQPFELNESFDSAQPVTKSSAPQSVQAPDGLTPEIVETSPHDLPTTKTLTSSVNEKDPRIPSFLDHEKTIPVQVVKIESTVNHPVIPVIPSSEVPDTDDSTQLNFVPRASDSGANLNQDSLLNKVKPVKVSLDENKVITPAKPSEIDVSRVEPLTAGSVKVPQNHSEDGSITTTESTILEVDALSQPSMGKPMESQGNSLGHRSKDESPFGHVVRDLAHGLSNEQLEEQTGLQLGRPDHVDSVGVHRHQHLTANATVKPTSLPPSEVNLVVKQVADKLQLLAAARPKNGVTIHLNPQDLGSITVVVKSVGRLIDAQLSASDARVTEALDQNQTRLIEMMDSRGFQVQSVSVSQQTNQQTHQDSKPSWQPANDQQGQSQGQTGSWHGQRGQGNQQFDQPKSDIRAWVRRGEGFDFSF